MPAEPTAKITLKTSNAACIFKFIFEQNEIHKKNKQSNSLREYNFTPINVSEIISTIL